MDIVTIQPNLASAKKKLSTGSDNNTNVALSLQVVNGTAITTASELRLNLNETILVDESIATPPKSNINIVFGNYLISDHDINKLDYGHWLNDSIINSYGHLCYSNSLKSLFVFNSFTYSKWVYNKFSDVNIDIKRNNIDLKPYKYLIIPINHVKVHWSVVVVNCLNSTIYHFDSLNKAKLNDPIFTTVKNGLGKLDDDSNFLKSKNLISSIGICPRQENDFDCGVFVCRIMRLVSENSFDFTFDQNLVNKFRPHIKQEILNSKLLDFSVSNAIITNTLNSDVNSTSKLDD